MICCSEMFFLLVLIEGEIIADNWIVCSGVRGGPFPPPTRAPPERLRGGHPWGEALLILHLLAFPFLAPSTVAYLGGE